jgi:hypothetical protein
VTTIGTLRGVLFTALGGLALMLAVQQDRGSSAAMGPGYVPVLTAGLVLTAGVLMVLRRRAEATPLGAYRSRPLVVLVAVVAFAGLLENIGFVAAACLVVFTASLGTDRGTWAERVALAGLLAAAAALAFVWGLGLPLPLMPAGWRD